MKFEIPLVVERTEKNETRYNITPTKAKPFLKDIVPEVDFGKTFPFFELPSEIRNSIYEYLFQYPYSGIMVVFPTKDYRTRDRGPHLETISRDMDADFRFSKWHEARPWHIALPWPSGAYRPSIPSRPFQTRPLAEILAPLTVNRQFYTEAMPVFYSVNRFYFGTPASRDIRGTLRALAPERRKHIRHISLCYTHEPSMPWTFRELKNLPGLRKLDIHVEDDVVRVARGDWTAPGLYSLCKLRGLEAVTIEGYNSDAIKARVVSSLTKPKELLEGLDERKRKRRDLSDGQD